MTTRGGSSLPVATALVCMVASLKTLHQIPTIPRLKSRPGVRNTGTGMVMDGNGDKTSNMSLHQPEGKEDGWVQRP